ncbi:MAG: hypothetical protein P1V13_23615 [Rhizobiaceae bacterium]|nr:hypothetical protein [Rhizobiaceae bacterium]
MTTFVTRRFCLISLIVALLAATVAIAIGNQPPISRSWTKPQGVLCHTDADACLSQQMGGG